MPFQSINRHNTLLYLIVCVEWLLLAIIYKLLSYIERIILLYLRFWVNTGWDFHT